MSFLKYLKEEMESDIRGGEFEPGEPNNFGTPEGTLQKETTIEESAMAEFQLRIEESIGDTIFESMPITNDNIFEVSEKVTMNLLKLFTITPKGPMAPDNPMMRDEEPDPKNWNHEKTDRLMQQYGV